MSDNNTQDIEINIDADVRVDSLKSKGDIVNYLQLIDYLNRPIDDRLVNVIKNFKMCISEMMVPIMSEIMSERFRQISLKLGKAIREYLCELSDIKISPETIIAFKRISFMMYVKDNNWPLFLIDDEKFIDEVLEIKKGTSGKGIENVIWSYLDNDYIDRMYESWKCVDNICKERFPLLEEAIKLYKEQYYYGSTSILMCQLDGIATDIFGANIPEDSNDEIIERIRRVYRSARITNPNHNISIRDVQNHDKLKLLWASGSVEHGPLLWQIIANYIFENVYASGNNANYDNPCRNKICHGDQLNYGTKEHAIKAILIIDLLFNLMYEHNCIVNIDQDN